MLAGEASYRAKLTVDQVKEIRADVHSSNAALGRRYGVARSAIRSIRIGKTWKAVA